MKTVVNFFENRRVTFGDKNVDVLKGWRLRALDFDNLKSYMTFKWEPMNELLVKNKRTYRTRGDQSEIISLRINKHLCHLMKWIVENEDGTYRLGPNMKMELRREAPDKIPDPDIAGQYEDLQEDEEGDRVAVFFQKGDER